MDKARLALGCHVKSIFSSAHTTTVVILLLTVAALMIRLPGLDVRPFHGDEANQAFRTGKLLETGKYEYDPRDHHGPTLYYLTLVPAWLAGQATFEDTQDWTYRIVPVCFGAGLILLTLLLRSGMNTSMLMVSGLLLCLSPAFVFYSRYYIQEMLLVFFTLAAIGFGYRYLLKPSMSTALLTGASLSLMHASKETAVIAYASTVAGLVVVAIRCRNDGVAQSIVSKIKKRHIIGGLLIALAINIVLYTAFFTHARGPLDSILSYGHYLKRADGAGLHDKPWDYYLNLLAFSQKGPQYWFSEGLILFLGGVGILHVFIAQCRKSQTAPFILFLATYVVCMTVVYALIPYKTPWSMLSFLHGIILMAGYGFYTLLCVVKSFPAKSVLVGLLLLGAAHLGYQSYLVNLIIPTDIRNPYVYAHTSSAAMKIVKRAHQLKAVHPDPDNMVIFVIQPNSDYWPLPYYLRDINHVGFYPSIPDTIELADMIIAEPALAGLMRKARPDYVEEMGGLRPSRLRHIYIRRELWDTFMETQE